MTHRKTRVKRRRKPALGIYFPETDSPRPRGPGYNIDLPSMPPFMYVENKKVLGDLGVIAFGAYNALGLIGPEKGGVAIVTEEPLRSVVATKDIPYDPAERALEFERAVGLVGNFLKPARRGGRKVKVLPAKRVDEFVGLLREAGYDVRV